MTPDERKKVIEEAEEWLAIGTDPDPDFDERIWFDNCDYRVEDLLTLAKELMAENADLQRRRDNAIASIKNRDQQIEMIQLNHRIEKLGGPLPKGLDDE